MAGIFVNVNDDIQNLRALKNEIENVKKALKGINVKVDFDIKEGLEKQLRSLTSEYDALASKIAEAEGRIKASTERINESTRKIIEAQEKIIGSAQGQSTPQQNVSATTTETASIQAQSKAYDELKADIDAVLGSRAENIKRMVEEQNAIRLINAELKQMEKNSGGGNYSPAQIKRIEQLNNALFTHKTALAEVRQALNNNAKMDNAAADSMSRLSQELGRMRMAYRELTDEERKSPFGQELLKSIQVVDGKLKEFDASIGIFQRNVGNYGSAFNGLGTSVQQIVRELPSAAMGLNTFFLAISNNLPILIDEINRAKKANAELIKTGEKGIPVWKQVASSLFSWQTALMVGISLLSMYGKDLMDWIGNLFKGESALNSLESALDRVNDNLKDNLGNYGELVTELQTLQAKWSDLGDNLSQKSNIIKQNASFFKELGIEIRNVSEAESLLADPQKSQAVINALSIKAQAAAAYQLAIEENKKAMLKAVAAEKQMANTNIWDYWNAGIDVIMNLDAAIQGKGVWNPEKYAVARAGGLLLESDAAKEAALSYDKLFKKLSEQANQLLIDAGFVLTSEGGTTTSLRDMADTLLDIQRQNQQAEIDLMEEGKEKRLKQIDLNYQLELDKITKWRKQLLEAQGGKLTADQEAMLGMATVLAEDKKNASVEDKEYDKLLEKYQGYFEKRKAIEEQYNKERQRLQEGGASEETLAENEYQKNKALEEVDALFAARDEEFRVWAAQVVDVSLEELQNLVLEAESMIADMEKNDPNNKQIANARAGLKVVKGEIEKRRSKTKEEKPDPEAKNEWQELYSTLKKVDKQFGEIGDTIGGTVGEIISAAGGIASSTISIIDGIQSLTGAASTAMGQTAETSAESISTVEKASIILAIISEALKIATAIGKMFSADYDNYNKAKENYGTYIEVLDKVIDKQKELAETMTGKDAVEASERVIELIEKQKDAAKELGKMRLNAGASAGSHSIGVRTKKNMSEEGWEQALAALGTAQYNKIREGRMEGLFNLSVEQLEKLQSEAIVFWAQLDDDVRGFLEQIIECNEAVEETLIKEKELFTGMSFEDFSSDILESLYDVEKGAEEIFDDMSDYMRKALIKSMYVKNYEPEMKKWYEQWSKAMEDGTMTTEEKDSLDALKNSIINGATAAAENINSMFDVSEIYNQEASAKSFETMTQDQVTELNGRFTALQQSGEEIKTQMTLMNATMNDLKSVGLNIQDVASSIQDLIANSYIELVTISENTGETVKCLKVIQSDIAQVKENTKNL